MRLTTYRKRSRSALPLVLVVLFMTCSPGLSICTAIHHHLHTEHAESHRHGSPSPEPAVTEPATTGLSVVGDIKNHTFHTQCTDRSHRHISVPSILNNNLPDAPAKMSQPETNQTVRTREYNPVFFVSESPSGEGHYRMTCFVRPVVLLI